MSDSLFPSGPWTGFYNYQPGDRHRMDLQLAFANGVLQGDGNDDVGRFLIRGKYDVAACECYWTKSYIGAHDVFYRGFREGKGIWGTWEISLFAHGGFHIWPRHAGESETETLSREEPADAVSQEPATVSVPGEGDPQFSPRRPDANNRLVRQAEAGPRGAVSTWGGCYDLT